MVASPNKIGVGVILYVIILVFTHCETTPSTTQNSIVSKQKTTANELDSLLTEVGNYQHIYPDSALAQLQFIEAENTIENDSNVTMRLQTFYGLDAYYRTSYTEAITYFQEAIKWAEALHDSVQKGMILNNLGSIHLDMGNLENAQLHFEQALDIMMALDNHKWISNSTQNLAGVYFRQNLFKECLAQMELSIEYGLKAQNYKSVAGAYSNLAMVYSQLNDQKTALTQFKKGIQLLEEIKDKRGLSIVYTKLGELQIEMGAEIDGLQTLHKSIQLSKEIHQLESLGIAYVVLAQVYEKKGNLDSSLFYLKQNNLVKKEYYELVNQEKIAELEGQYQFKKNKASILQLQNEAKIDEAVNQAQRLKIALLLAVSVLLVALLVFIFFQWRINKKNAILLSEKNKLIQESLVQRELLYKEAHHRIKNNFQFISSLLMLRASAHEEPSVKQSLMEFREKFQALSQIHQQLYSKDEFNEVSLADFINRLVAEIDSSYNEHECDIKLNIENRLVSSDTAVVIGFFLTESLMNAFKYAFNESHQNDPTICISLSSIENKLHLEIKDNGKGFDTLNVDDLQSFGFKMIKKMVQQKKGNLSIENGGGAKIIITFDVD